MNETGHEWARFTLTGAPSFTSDETGLLKAGQSIMLPSFMDLRLPPIFDVKGAEKKSEWPVCLEGGLGDKIYSLPSLYVFDGIVGIGTRDEPLFRLVKNKVRQNQHNDCNVLVGIGHYEEELTDQIARRFEVYDKLKLRLPILETTVEEKNQVKEEDDYIVLCLWGSAPDRSWSDGLALKNEFDCRVEIVFRKEAALLPLVERAKCVISVNTSLVPLAGAFQVPLIAIDTQARTADLLDVEHAERNVRSVLEAYNRLKARKYLQCWCGGKNHTRLIRENLYVLKCSDCGTERQDVKLSDRGIREFYQKHYHRGWREVVEGAVGYECRMAGDVELAHLRLDQIGPLEGKKWLDVGCGNGAMMVELQARGWQAEGMDLDPLPALLQGILTVDNWEETGMYDVVSFVDCLEHGFAKEQLEKAVEHLNPDGKIVVEIPVAQEKPIHYRRLQHLWFFEETTFNKMIKSMNLKVHKMLRPITGKRTAIIGRSL